MAIPAKRSVYRLGVAGGNAGTLVLTGHNTYGGGTDVGDGSLQVGDGIRVGASITGFVDVVTADGLVFDVASTPSGDATASFDGQIVTVQTPGPGINLGPGAGSVLKTGPGTLVLTATQDFPNTYLGAMTVDQGTLRLGSQYALAQGTPLIVNEGAEVNLAGNSTADLSTVTLNDGNIVSTNTSGSTVAATLTASDSFNLAQGRLAQASLCPEARAYRSELTGSFTSTARFRSPSKLPESSTTTAT